MNERRREGEQQRGGGSGWKPIDKTATDLTSDWHCGDWSHMFPCKYWRLWIKWSQLYLPMIDPSILPSNRTEKVRKMWVNVC